MTRDTALASMACASAGCACSVACGYEGRWRRRRQQQQLTCQDTTRLAGRRGAFALSHCHNLPKPSDQTSLKIEHSSRSNLSGACVRV